MVVMYLRFLISSTVIRRLPSLREPFNSVAFAIITGPICSGVSLPPTYGMSTFWMRTAERGMWNRQTRQEPSAL